MTLRKIFGIAGSASLVIGSFLALPTVAHAAVVDVVIDCNSSEPAEIVLSAGDSASITTVNCNYGISDWNVDDPSIYSLDLGAQSDNIDGGDTLVVSSPADPEQGISDWIDFEGSNFVTLYITLIPTVSDPSGTLITSADATIDGTNPGVLDFSSEDNPDGEHYVGGNADECDVVAGMHQYGTLQFHVSESGEYTFRVVGVNPADPDVDPSASTSYPTDDPYLALYSSFDPAHPDDNVVGCNDDRPFRSYNSDGVLLDRQWSEFTSELAPGNYTLVYTSWGTYNDWPAATDGLNQNVTFEFWGPEGGLSLGALAETGTNAVTPLNALGMLLIIAGAALLIARRVRTN